MPNPNQTPDPERNSANAQLVRTILTSMVANHPTIRPDDISFLPDAICDWTRLVENDFPANWRSGSLEMLTYNQCKGVREDGAYRLENFPETNTLATLFYRSRESESALREFHCALILLGNLIEDAIYRQHPDLARVVQLQINSIYNAGANEAFEEASFRAGEGGIVLSLPEHAPQAPELENGECSV